MFYDTFKSLCDEKGVSCTRAALEIGLSNATPTKWKKTGAMPDSKTLAMVSQYFSVPISFLMGATTDPTDTSKTHWAQVMYGKEKAPTPEGERHADPDIRRIERARKNMSEADRKKMMTLLELSFEDYFSDDYEDDDSDE